MEKNATAWGRILILTGGLLFSGLVIVLHWLSPEFLPARHNLSQYALGDFGFLMTIAYLALALGLAGAAYRVIVEFPESANAKFGAFLLLLAAFSFLFAGLLPADPGDVAETMLGQIHAGSLLFGIYMILLGSLWVSLKMRSLAGSSGWIALVLVFAINGLNYWYRNASDGLSGWQQRALFAGIVFWLLTVALAPSDEQRVNVGES